jgi:hypothetical protein
MKQFLTGTALLLALSLTGCGGGDQGPADASETPQISEEEIMQEMMRGMPEDAKAELGIEGGSEAPKSEEPASEAPKSE